MFSSEKCEKIKVRSTIAGGDVCDTDAVISICFGIWREWQPLLRERGSY